MVGSLAIFSSFRRVFTEAPTVTAEAAYMVAATAGASSASAICIEIHLIYQDGPIIPRKKSNFKPPGGIFFQKSFATIQSWQRVSRK